MKLNWAALGLVAFGAILLLIAWQGTQRKVWAALTGKTQTDPANSKTPFTLDGIVYPDVGGGGFGTFGNSPNDYQHMAIQDAQAAGIDPTTFVKQIQAESGFNPNAVSPAGAIGIAQFMPSTAKGMGVNPKDPVASLKAAALLMGAYVQRFGTEAKALAAYNAGSGATQSAIDRGGINWENYVPAETQNYITTITGVRPPSQGGHPQ